MTTTRNPVAPKGVSQEMLNPAGIRVGTLAPPAQRLEREFLAVVNPDIRRAHVPAPRSAELVVPQDAHQGWAAEHLLQV